MKQTDKTHTLLLAKYTGWQIYPGGNLAYRVVDASGKEEIKHLSDFKFQESWDELMPVVEKIEKEYRGEYKLNTEYCYDSDSWSCYVVDINGLVRFLFNLQELEFDSRILSVYNACIQLIEFENRLDRIFQEDYRQLTKDW